MDGDEPWDDWEDARGLPTDRDNAREDPDNDRRLNLVEYAVGLNPLGRGRRPVLFVFPEFPRNGMGKAASRFPISETRRPAKLLTSSAEEL